MRSCNALSRWKKNNIKRNLANSYLQSQGEREGEGGKERERGRGSFTYVLQNLFVMFSSSLFSSLLTINHGVPRIYTLGPLLIYPCPCTAEDFKHIGL